MLADKLEKMGFVKLKFETVRPSFLMKLFDENVAFACTKTTTKRKAADRLSPIQILALISTQE